VLGSFRGEFRKRSVTHVAPTLIASAVEEHLGFVPTRTRPDMSRKPWERALSDMVRPVVSLNNDRLGAAREMYIREACGGDLNHVHVFDLRTAINGKAGVLYCDKLPRKTSAGAPYKCSKQRFLVPYDDGTTDVDVVPEIKATMDEIVETYQRGERYHPVFCGQLKDEPVSFAKAESGKTRLFTMASLAHTLVVRQHLLGVVMLMQRHQFDYELGVGISAQCAEWHELHRYLTQHGDARMIAGDYGKFDKRMPANVILAAFDVIIHICERAGYAAAELAVVRGIAYDTAFPVVDYNGELVEFYGGNPSGHALTVIVNSIVNALYMRYCFIELRPPGCALDFKACVALFTYGDDNAMGVAESAPWFTHTAIQRVLADADIEYTMADKEAASVPYIPMSDVTFLKRAWRWEPDVGCYVGPLASESIGKMLTVCVAKANISAESHAMQVIGTAVREAFFHGRQEYERVVAGLRLVVKDMELEVFEEENTFPSWDALCADFTQRSKDVRAVVLRN